MKKLFISFAVTALVITNVNAYEHEKSEKLKNYKNEALPCPLVLTLMDGMYIGGAIGFDSYRMVDEVLEHSALSHSGDPQSIELDPRLNSIGIVGGGFVGFGKYFPNFYNAYFGIELFGNASSAHTDYELTLLRSSSATVFTTHVEAKSSYGIGFLPGIKLSDANLFYVRLGWNWSDIVVEQSYNANGTVVPILNKSNSSQGFGYGLGIESAVLPHISARVEYTHTGYSSVGTEIGSEVTPSNNQFITAVIYHIG